VRSREDELVQPPDPQKFILRARAMFRTFVAEFNNFLYIFDPNQLTVSFEVADFVFNPQVRGSDG
jgi:hypothetical protein